MSLEARVVRIYFFPLCFERRVYPKNPASYASIMQFLCILRAPTYWEYDFTLDNNICGYVIGYVWLLVNTNVGKPILTVLPYSWNKVLAF